MSAILILRGVAVSILTLAAPASLIAVDSPLAMLYAKGTTWINGSTALKCSALFVGDLLQTDANALANIKAVGLNVIISPGSVLEVQNNSLRLSRGALTVGTSRIMAVQANDLRIAPASAAWTVFRVLEADGIVQIEARNGDLVLSDGTTLHQGQEVNREGSAAQPKRRGGSKTRPAATGGPLNSRPAILSGVGGCWLDVVGSLR